MTRELMTGASLAAFIGALTLGTLYGQEHPPVTSTSRHSRKRRRARKVRRFFAQR